MTPRCTVLSVTNPEVHCWRSRNEDGTREHPVRWRRRRLRIGRWWTLPRKHQGPFRTPVNQLRLVVYPIIYRVLAPSQAVVLDLFHQRVLHFFLGNWIAGFRSFKLIFRRSSDVYWISWDVQGPPRNTWDPLLGPILFPLHPTPMFEEKIWVPLVWVEA